MKRKSHRDEKEFTLYQLAKNLKMPHSMLIKLLHENPEKRVHNPRVDTLGRIVDFFKADGFDVTVDDLLNGLRPEGPPTISFVTEKTVPVYSFNVEEDKIAEIEITLPKNSDRVIALLSHELICPVFEHGSMFIIDKDYPVEDGLLVAVKIPHHSTILLGKIRMDGEKKIFVPSDKTFQEIILTPEKDQDIIGVVVQVNPNIIVDKK